MRTSTAPKYEIQSDRTGPFIVARGRTYRPRFPKQYGEAYPSGTSLKIGARVPATVSTDGPILVVGSGTRKPESWCSQEFYEFMG